MGRPALAVCRGLGSQRASSEDRARHRRRLVRALRATLCVAERRPSHPPAPGGVTVDRDRRGEHARYGRMVHVSVPLADALGRIARAAEERARSEPQDVAAKAQRDPEPVDRTKHADSVP